jgi:UDP-galactopyranose mutase
MKSILIVGAGFSGATLARELAEKGYHVTIIDKRNHVAGNAYDEIHQTYSQWYHKYGPHIFHTNNEHVWEYLSNFTSWVPYKHKVKAFYNNEYWTLPPNKITSERMSKDEIIDVFYKPYTKKMWNMELEDLDPSIKDRVKPRDDLNEFYFPNDKYQALPLNGYSTLISNMLEHNDIDIRLNLEFQKDDENHFDYIFNSMPIDEYFEFEHGELPYRSIKFAHRTTSEYVHSEASVVNLTSEYGPTRITDWSKFPNSFGKNPMFTEEYPCDYRENGMERYYPVKDIDGNNRKTYEKYKQMVNKDKMTFIGRCGQYVYIDMDMAVNSSLQLAKKF